MKIKLLTLAILMLSSTVVMADRPGQAAIERASSQHQRVEKVQRQDQLRARTEARAGSNGAVAREVTKTKTDTGFEHHSSATNAQGQDASRDTLVTRDSDSQTRTRETSGQSFDGSTYSATAVIQKTDAGLTRNATRTNGDGEVASRSTLVTRDTDTKSVSRETTGQTFNGDSYSTSSVRQRTEDGYSQSTTRTNAEGQMANRELQVTRDPESQTVTRTSTGQNFEGESFSGSTVRQKTDNGYISSSERTNTDGDSVSRSVVATVDRDNGVASKEITRVDADGESTTRTVEVSINNTAQ